MVYLPRATLFLRCRGRRQSVHGVPLSDVKHPRWPTAMPGTCGNMRQEYWLAGFIMWERGAFYTLNSSITAPGFLIFLKNLRLPRFLVILFLTWYSVL